MLDEPLAKNERMAWAAASKRAVEDMIAVAKLKATSQQRAGYFVFLLFMLAMYDLFSAEMAERSGGLSTNGAGEAVRQVLYVGLFFSAFIAFKVTSDLRQLLIVPASFLLLLTWAWASSLWALDMGIAIRRLSLCTIVILTVFLCAEHAGFERATRMVRHALLLMLVLSYISILVLPTAVHQGPDTVDADIAGSWRGILWHKNFAGAVCAMTIIYFLFGPRNISRSLRWATIVAAAYFLYRTRSKTSMGLLPIAILAGAAYYYFPVRYRTYLILSIATVVVLGSAIVIASLDLTRPDTLTGRSQIWQALIAYSRDHLWFGSGYGSFWNIGDNGPIHAYTNDWVAQSVAQGHNGYLDLLVQIGLPGLVLAITAMIVVPGWNLTRAGIPSRHGALVIAALSFCMEHNFTESTIFTPNYIVEIFFLIAVALAQQVARESRRQKRQRARITPLDAIDARALVPVRLSSRLPVAAQANSRGLQ